MLSSSYFNEMLLNSQPNLESVKGGTPLQSRTITREIELKNGETPRALEIILQILHNQHYKVLGSAAINNSLFFFLDICTLINIYKCHQAVSQYTKAWYSTMADAQASDLTKTEIFTCIFSWVLNQSKCFNRFTNMAIARENNVVKYEVIPMPLCIVGAINQKRKSCIQMIIDEVHDTIDKSSSRTNQACSTSCDALTLGTLMKASTRLGLTPKPMSPFEGLSCQNLFVSLIEKDLIPHSHHSRPLPAGDQTTTNLNLFGVATHQILPEENMSRGFGSGSTLFGNRVPKPENVSLCGITKDLKQSLESYWKYDQFHGGLNLRDFPSSEAEDLNL
jgi:hypothetical protein